MANFGDHFDTRPNTPYHERNRAGGVAGSVVVLVAVVALIVGLFLMASAGDHTQTDAGTAAPTVTTPDAR